MGLQYKAKNQTTDERWLQMPLNETGQSQKTLLTHTFMPAEWWPQSGVEIAWPHADTDWAYMLKEVEECYIRIVYNIGTRVPILIVTPQKEAVERLLREKLPSTVVENIQWAQCDTNDTWTRDSGFITLIGNEGPILLDFRFNGWGMKYAACHDNKINRTLMAQHVLKGEYSNQLDFVFEGGSVESDGAGTLLVTSECLLSANRNDHLTKQEIEKRLKNTLHAQRVLWLDHGYLAGDDTDSHIDTLARFCPGNTIAYVAPPADETDEHYTVLTAMQAQLQSFRTAEDEAYNLIALPFPHAIYDENGCRLPATYANFLVTNGAVLMPTYKQPDNDAMAFKALQQAFPNHEIIGIDCCALIKQHGSLHCSTMQFPQGVMTLK